MLVYLYRPADMIIKLQISFMKNFAMFGLYFSIIPKGKVIYFDMEKILHSNYTHNF